MGINGLSYSQAMDTLKPALQDKPTEQVQRGTLFSELMDPKAATDEKMWTDFLSGKTGEGSFKQALRGKVA